MSAFIVSKKHIDAICTAAITYPSYGLSWKDEQGQQRQLNRGDNPSAIGQMLWHENIMSVSHRYPEDEPGALPGPIGLTTDKILGYRFRRMMPIPSVVQILKMINCLEYQSCEHDDWETSEAKRFLDTLRRELIHVLPGYDKADWAM